MSIITNAERTLLLYLAVNGPSVGNQIVGVENVSRTSRRLERMSLIVRTPGQYDFSPKPTYRLSLTVKGLSQVLTFKSTGPIISGLVKHWKHLLPGILDKWSFFRKWHVESIAKSRLQKVASIFLEMYTNLEANKSVQSVAIRKDLENNRFRKLMYSLRLTEEEGRDDWFFACVEDPEIRDAFASQIPLLIEETEANLKKFRSMKGWLSSRKSQRPEPSE